MVEFTLLELNLDGAEVTANAPFSDVASDEPNESGSDSSERGATGSSRRTGALGVLLGLAAVVGLVAVGRRLVSRRGSDEGTPASDEPIVAD